MSTCAVCHAEENQKALELPTSNEETVEAMDASRRGELVTVGGLRDLVADLNTDD